MEYALSRMTPDATLVCHNYLFENVAGCRFFDRIIERNRGELAAFLDMAGREFAGLVECTSTEGVGVGKRRTDQRTRPAPNRRSYDS